MRAWTCASTSDGAGLHRLVAGPQLRTGSESGAGAQYRSRSRKRAAARPHSGSRSSAGSASIARTVNWRALPGAAVAWIKALVFVLALLPLATLAQGVIADTLGANPVEAVTHSTGEWSLIMLCLTLAVTPLRRLSGANWLLRMRRMLGLFAFFYAVLHLATYVWLDQWFDWGAMLRDVLKRPFITVGFGALLLMLPLAVTSTQAMIRRLGRRWQALHRLVYAVAVLAVLHFVWMKAGKNDFVEPARYALIVAALLGARAWWWLRQRRAALPDGIAAQPGPNDRRGG
ncbi:MAG: sulfoxide reductase heme-binding subunit YedZ [Burkholderiales bacterium]|nr:MAG: sulfoxide reductase heme-binding subunit YedZ [Burkholderiales bacterium]